MRHIVLGAALVLPAAMAAAQEAWDSFHGSLAGHKYSPADQITPENVGELERAWSIETGDVSDGSGELPETVWSATPIFANDTLYLGTPFYRILALEPDTGAVKWSYNTESTLEALTQPGLKNRGVSYWEAEDPAEGEPCQRRVYIGTMDATLHAVDADTGELCTDFAENGVLDVNQWNDTNDRWPLSLLQPPTVYDDKLIIGWAGMDWEYSAAPPGTVFAVNARTGELEWDVSFIPEDMREQTGTANVWTAMSVDEERGLVYMPVSSPSPNYWGGNRTGEIPLATSVTAVDADTGEVEWAYQHVHHDIWDYDTVAAPTLVDVERDGETIPALVQSTKQGFLFVLDRETGEPLFEIEERDVPASDAEGEQAAPTQPFPTLPEPANDPENWPGVWWLADWTSFGGCSRRAEEMDYAGLYTPPSEAGTLTYPPTSGGFQWGGGAWDPERGIYYANSSRVVQEYRLIPRAEYEEIAGESGAEQGYYPQEGAPYGVLIQNFTNWAGMPCWKPPFGTMAAWDIATGEKLWETPFGMTQRYGFYMPEGWGSVTIGGPAVTAGGVIFIGASMDARVRALDAETGEELWRDNVEAPAVANPAVYTYEGRQYVVFVAGGNPILKPQVGDQAVAYALPD